MQLDKIVWQEQLWAKKKDVWRLVYASAQLRVRPLFLKGEDLGYKSLLVECLYCG